MKIIKKSQHLKSEYNGFKAKFVWKPSPDFEYGFAQRGDRIGNLKIIGNGIDFENRYNMDYHLVFMNIVTDIQALYDGVDIEDMRSLIAPFIEDKYYTSGFRHLVDKPKGFGK